jgi:peptide/nickel transport system substrate-binding protein
LSTKRTGAKALALLTGSALAVTACATSNSAGTAKSSAGASSTASTTTSTKFTWGYEQEYASYNSNTEDGNAAANVAVLNGVLRGFWYFAADGTLTPDKDFGSYEKTSNSPLTVKYSINPKAVWSDGKPIDCDDVTLTWLAKSGKSGKSGFSAATVAGYQDTNKPACKAGERDFTVTYTKPFADWASLYGFQEIMPAHIVEQKAGMTKTFVDLADTPTSPDLAKAITFYNKGWAVNPGEIKKDINPSSGPYVIDSWTAGQSLTLKANPSWWGTKPKTDTIVLRYIGGDAQSTALQNGEIDAMDPQPQVDLVNQLKALVPKIKYSPQDTFTFEHLDPNFAGEFKDKNLREAFAKCIPRKQIIDNLVKPLNANAKILESRYVLPFQKAYPDFESSVGGQKYDTTDIPGAKALLAGKTPTVRIGWRKDPAALNKRRVDTIALLQASCGQAGFKIVDAGTPTFFSKELVAGNFDVALFAYIGSALVTSSDNTYNTGGGNNHRAYSNPQVDVLAKQLDAELDKDKQTLIEKQIDTLLWTDLDTIPLFAFPSVLATSLKAQGVQYNATQQDLSWNAYDWAVG